MSYTSTSKVRSTAGPATVLLVDDDPFQAFARRSFLERRFASVERATDAAQALILLEQPEFARRLSLIVLSLHLPGLSGPLLVSELTVRLPSVSILVLGRQGEKAQDYQGQNVHLLPPNAPVDQMLSTALRILASSYPRVA